MTLAIGPVYRTRAGRQAMPTHQQSYQLRIPDRTTGEPQMERWLEGVMLDTGETVSWTLDGRLLSAAWRSESSPLDIVGIDETVS